MLLDKPLPRHAEELLDHWRGHNLITENDQADLTHRIEQYAAQAHTPLSIHIRAGIGATVSAAFLIQFFVKFYIFFFKGPDLLSSSVILILVAIAITKLLKKEMGEFKRSFLIQISLGVMATGKILLGIWITGILAQDPAWEILIVLLITTAITYPFYTLCVDRFISLWLILYVLFYNLIITGEHALPGNFIGHSPWVDLFFALQLATLVFLMSDPARKKRYEIPVYALLAALMVEIFSLTFPPLASGIHGGWNDGITFNIMLVAVLSLMIKVIFGQGHSWRLSTVLPMALILLLLALFSTPGILLSLAMILAGYAQYDRIFLTSGILLLPVFIFFYYYHLDVDLMTKSAILVASGGLLLLARHYLHTCGVCHDP